MNNNQKGIAPIVIILIVVGVLVVGGAIWYWQKSKAPEQKACTEEAKICPDGSYVSRTGPNCEFAACPETKTDETANWKTYRNEKYGFEVKYPKDWKLQEYPYKYSNDINIVIDPVKVYSEAELSSSELPPRLINISINFEEGSKNYTGVDIKIGDNILAKKTEEITSDSPNPFMTNKHRISYQIDNFKCCGYSRDVSRMSIHYVSDKTDKYLEKFNQILSTFKFIK